MIGLDVWGMGGSERLGATEKETLLITGKLVLESQHGLTRAQQCAWQWVPHTASNVASLLFMLIKTRGNGVILMSSLPHETSTNWHVG